MGRGKVQLKQIENKISRQVTFSKRRTGLLKKAHEISVLCDVEVALIVFSNKGKLYEYASNSNMDHVLERYDGYSCAEQKLNGTESNPQVSLSAEYAKLVKKIDVIQRNIRYFMGEDVDSLCLRELQNLEQQINSSLKRIRKKRNQAMNERISQMQKKDKALQEENNILKKKLKGNDELMRQQSYSGQADLVQSSSSFPFASAQPSIPFEPLASSTNFQTTAITDKPEVENLTNNSRRILPWMI